MERQIHESIGHPIELDRVLGMEEAYAGSSFLTPGDRGSLKYASPLVSITADATLPGGLGTFGFDDEGVPAQRVPVIVDGIFQNFLTSRETAAVVDQSSNGTSRADGWSHLPLIRMTNISIEPPRSGTGIGNRRTENAPQPRDARSSPDCRTAGQRRASAD